MSREEDLRRSITAVKALEPMVDDVDVMEDSEAVTNLAIPRVLKLIPDHRLRDDIRWLQDANATQSRQRWTNVAELAISPFERSGGAERVKRYHELEQHVAKLEEDLESVEDSG